MSTSAAGGSPPLRLLSGVSENAGGGLWTPIEHHDGVPKAPFPGPFEVEVVVGEKHVRREGKRTAFIEGKVRSRVKLLASTARPGECRKVPRDRGLFFSTVGVVDEFLNLNLLLLLLLLFLLLFLLLDHLRHKLSLLFCLRPNPRVLSFATDQLHHPTRGRFVFLREQEGLVLCHGLLHCLVEYTRLLHDGRQVKVNLFAE